MKKSGGRKPRTALGQFLFVIVENLHLAAAKECCAVVSVGKSFLATAKEKNVIHCLANFALLSVSLFNVVAAAAESPGSFLCYYTKIELGQKQKRENVRARVYENFCRRSHLSAN
jgi:hypothetical protein